MLYLAADAKISGDSI